MKPVDRTTMFAASDLSNNRSLSSSSNDGNVVLEDMKKTTGFVEDMDLIFIEIEKPFFGKG